MQSLPWGMSGCPQHIAAPNENIPEDSFAGHVYKENRTIMEGRVDKLEIPSLSSASPQYFHFWKSE